jgi:hypothetical protein
MNFIYTFYKSSGEIVENINVSEEVFNNIISETQYQYIEGSYDNENYYIDNGTPVLKPLRPDIFHYFDYVDKLWKPADGYLVLLRNRYTTFINNWASDFITSKYPLYRQLNFIGTIDYEPMRIWIDEVRSLSNIANLDISNATSQEQCINYFETFKGQLNELSNS